MKKKIWEFKFLFIPTIAIGLVIVGLPWLTWSNYPKTTITYIYVFTMIFLILLRTKDAWPFDTGETFDKVVTILIWIISIPVFVVIGLACLVIVVLWKRSIYRVGNFLSITVIFIFGVKLKIVGTRPKTQFIATPNHCSTVDDVVDSIIMGFSKWKVVYASEIVRIPFVKLLLKSSNIGIPITRTEASSRKEVAQNMKQALLEGFNILIFPEGRRLPVEKKDDLLLPFFDGPFLLSAYSGVPILPVIISWTFLFKPRSGQWWFSPRTITVYYLEPEFKKEEESLENFKERVRNKMLSVLKDSIEKD